MSQHKPWNQESSDDLYVMDDAGLVVAQCRDAESATQIVRCVNAHVDLVAACKAAIACVGPLCLDAYQQLQDAVDKAT